MTPVCYVRNDSESALLVLTRQDKPQVAPAGLYCRTDQPTAERLRPSNSTSFSFLLLPLRPRRQLIHPSPLVTDISARSKMDYERPSIPIRLTSPHSLPLASPFHFSPFLLLEQTLFSVIRQLCAPFLYSIILPFTALTLLSITLPLHLFFWCKTTRA
jgi:hypothetical protein